MLKLREYSRLGKPYLFLISGKAGTGKTTVANLAVGLVEEIGFVEGARFSFATPIKTVARASIWWDGVKDEKGRRLLQHLGQVGREYDEFIWAKRLNNELKKRILPYDFVFVDDWRFPNELEFFKNRDDNFVVTIRVHAPDRESLVGQNEAQDVSEVSLPEKKSDPLYDFVIYNGKDVTRDELRKRVLEVITEAVDLQVKKYLH